MHSYLGIFRPLIKQLVRHAVRTEQFLLLVPGEVAETDPNLRPYFVPASSTMRTSIIMQ